MEIVSLAPSNTEILFELGAGDLVVATTSLCDHPREAVDKESVGGWTSGIDFDRVEEIDPDLALASDDLQDEAVEELEKRGVNVTQLNPYTLEQVYGSVERVGRLVGREEKALELVEGMREQLEELSIPGTRVYCEEWMSPPMVSGNWIPGLVTGLGGEYFIQEGERSRRFELAELQRFDPEHIFLNVCGAGENIDPGEVLQRDEWRDITAVEQENVHVIDDALLNRPGPRLVEGARRIVKAVNSQASF